MLKDFHYFATALIARCAGFSAQDALTIAYASQYVNDATEGSPMRIHPDTTIRFEPVRTALFDGPTTWSEQKQTVIPFHFLPPLPFTPPGFGFTYLVDDGSPFSRLVLDDACHEEDVTRRLCRIGIALHAMADTWAHQGFSGRKNVENQIENIEIFTGKVWEEHETRQSFHLGHYQAGEIMDTSHLTWRCVKTANGEIVERDNTEVFLIAARHLYEALRSIYKPSDQTSPQWEEVELEVKRLLAIQGNGLIKRCERWKRTFGELFTPHELEYNRLTWREEALVPVSKAGLDWDSRRESDFSWMQFRMKDDFFDSSWYHFHRAALQHRLFVLERLP
jgi:hypothetical protein